MTDGGTYLVVSSDSHAGPSLERSLRPFCPPQYLEPFDAFVHDLRSGAIARGERDDQITIGDRLLNATKRAISDEVFAGAMDLVKQCAGHDDPYARLMDMDAEGVAAELIFAGGQNDETLPFVGFGADSGPAGVSHELRRVGEQIWNRWLSEFTGVAPERLIGVAQVPIWDIDAAIEEITWAREHNLGAVNLPAPRQDLVPYNNPVYDPFWSACEDLGLPLVTHTGGGDPSLGWESPGGRYVMSYERFWLTRRHLQQMIFGGVFERHPKLSVIFTEQMVSWVPQTLADLDNVYLMGVERDRRHNPLWEPVPKKPSEYWASNCYNAGSFLAHHEAEMRHEVGLHNLLWGTDYPHHEGTWPNTRLAMRKTFAGIPEEDVRLILGENALKAYNLDAAPLRKIADRIGPGVDELNTPLSSREIPAHPGFAFREFENF